MDEGRVVEEVSMKEGAGGETSMKREATGLQ